MKRLKYLFLTLGLIFVIIMMVKIDNYDSGYYLGGSIVFVLIAIGCWRLEKYKF